MEINAYWQYLRHTYFTHTIIFQGIFYWLYTDIVSETSQWWWKVTVISLITSDNEKMSHVSTLVTSVSEHCSTNHSSAFSHVTNNLTNHKSDLSILWSIKMVLTITHGSLLSWLPAIQHHEGEDLELRSSISHI